MTGTTFASEPMKIGKHEWRVIVYKHPSYGNCTGFEWRRPGDYLWRWERDWPTWDGNHCDSGMPKTLRRLFDCNAASIETALKAA